MERVTGFSPVYDANSRLLILGSFPSVKSRQTGFYYGNPQNAFWKTVCGFFGEEVPQTVERKRAFLLRRHIALWDVVISCKIVGSSDASIQEEEVAELPSLLEGSKITHIFCNGAKSYTLLAQKYPSLLCMARRLSSTSPANPRFSEVEWREALCEVFYDHV